MYYVTIPGYAQKAAGSRRMQRCPALVVAPIDISPVLH